MTKRLPPTVCRECDYREYDRCYRYDRALTTLAKGFDAGICYGREREGKRELFVDKYRAAIAKAERSEQ